MVYRSRKSSARRSSRNEHYERSSYCITFEGIRMCVCICSASSALTCHRTIQIICLYDLDIINPHEFQDSQSISRLDRLSLTSLVYCYIELMEADLHAIVRHFRLVHSALISSRSAPANLFPTRITSPSSTRLFVDCIISIPLACSIEI